MRRVFGFVCVVLAASALLASAASAQVTDGRIRGRVTDEAGAAMAGVSVTLESAALIQPMVRVTAVSGRYEFPIVPVGTYTVSFELTDFKRVVRTGVVVDTGFEANVNAQLEPGASGDTITISGPAQVVDTRRTSTGATFTREVMENVPTARDPWQIVSMAAGVQASDLNVGGNLSGQQVTFTARGQGQASTMWNVDGATVTDMAATGTSPYYFDFESLQEIHVTTGGADASLQTGGININLVTRSGSDVFNGAARGLYSDDNVQWQNVTEELFEQGAGSGAPIKYYREYGAQAGGPIVLSRAWWWFAAARQDINGSVPGFYDTARPECDPPSGGFANLESSQDCLKDDLTFIYAYSGKLHYQPHPSNRFQSLYTYANKTRNARGATQDLAPESVRRQTSDGPPSFSFRHTWEVTDALVFDSRVQHSDAGFNLLPQVGTEDRQRLVIRETGFTSRGLFTTAREIRRPTTEVKTDGSIFVANLLGGDHTTRFGVRYRNTPTQDDTFWTGGAEARLSTRYTAENPRYGSVNEGGPLGPDRAELYRPGSDPTGLWAVAAYLQDSYTRGRLRVHVGARWDYQNDEAKPGCVDANPILPDILPARCFDGADRDVNFSDVAPRLSVAYDLLGTGRTVLKGGYAQYYAQGVGLSRALSLLGGVTVTFANAPARTCWNDANGDTFVQRSELNLAESSCLQIPANYDPGTGLRPRSMNEVDPDLQNERTQEFTAGMAHEVAPNLAVGVDYVHRVYDRFRSNVRMGETKDMWVAREWTDADAVAAGVEPPSAFDLPANGWIYYEFNPELVRPLSVTRMQNTDERRVYDGVDLTLRKRFSDRWMMNAAVTLQRRIDDPIFCLDCTNIDRIEGLNNQTAYLVRLNGMYALLKDFTVSANLQIEQGENRTIEFDGPPSGYRAGGINGNTGFASTLEATRFTAYEFGAKREPLVHLLDAQVTKTVGFRGGRNRLSLVFSVFNLLNANTARGFENDLNDADFGRVTSILAPRVARLQASITF